MGCRMKFSWTPAAEIKLRKLYPDLPAKQVAAAIGCGVRAIYNKSFALGLKKSAAFYESDRSGRIMRGKQNPAMIASQFKPGHPTWNKGVHCDFGGRSHETRFKPGSVPPNRRDVGALRITSEGNLEIKIAHGLRMWKTLSHYVWWRETGTWPPRRHVLRARNGDSHDTRIENLELLQRAENMRRNSYHTNYPPDVARLFQLKGAINRQVNRIKKGEP